MPDPRRYYITTPIYYVNDRPHIGHAYTSLAVDASARFMRLDGYDVLFVTGTDEHGQKIQRSAELAAENPQTFCDRISTTFRNLSGLLNLSNDDFIRTTEARHRTAARAIWQALVDAGDIYLDSYAGWYSVRDEQFFASDELQKAADGSMLAPSGAVCEWVEEPSYFFRLSAWQDRLLDLYATRADFIQPATRRNEVISFVKSGLRDLSISRTTFDWGIPVPGDERHVMYVWLDALTNYLSAVDYPNTDSAAFKAYWPVVRHMVGKDILRFHAVYWPAFLMAAGIDLPRGVFAHGWWTNEGRKISKSLGNVIDPAELVTRYGLDQTRYFLLREVPFGNDGDFSHAAMIRRINGDLANDLGNLAQRVLSMIHKNCGAALPQPAAFAAADDALLAACDALLPALRTEIAAFAYHRALEALWRVVAAANAYVDEQAPWALRKTDPERMGTVLYVLAEVVRQLAVLVQPFMPDSAARLLDQLGVPGEDRSFAGLGGAGRLAPATPITRPIGVFPRFVDGES